MLKIYCVTKRYVGCVLLCAILQSLHIETTDLRLTLYIMQITRTMNLI